MEKVTKKTHSKEYIKKKPPKVDNFYSIYEQCDIMITLTKETT